MGKPDDNRRYVTMAITNDSNEIPTAVQMDSATGRILCEVINESKTPTVTDGTPPDDNGVHVTTITDDSGNVYPLHMTSDGAILVDLLKE